MERGLSGGRDPAESIACIQEAGAGPIATVWLGERRRGALVRPVALKVFERRFPRDAEVLYAMRDRGRMLSGIEHRTMVPIDDVARVGQRLALVRAWVDGLDLLEWVEILRERDIAMPGRVVCEIVHAAASALDAAQSVVPPGETGPLAMEHRDFKPTNVMIRRDGEVQVVDFGTGFTSIAGRNARAGALQKGLVKYLSPARRDGKRGGPSNDVYALGILALELFRGRWLRRLHQHNPAHDRHLAEVVARLDKLGARTAADGMALRNVLLRMVAWDADGRPSAGEVAHIFRTLADRANGPSLAAWATAHLGPYIPPMEADPSLPVPSDVVILPDRLEDADIPPPPEEEDDAPRGSPQWEETEDGWRIILDDDDDEDITLLTPTMALARSTLPPIPEDEPEDEPIDQTTTAEVVAVPISPAPPAPRIAVLPPVVGLPIMALGIAAAIGAIIGAALIAAVFTVWFAK